jgi:hypothetical protein
MKKSILTIAVCAMLGAVTVSSCKKYEDGPSFSLMTKKSRLSGEWSIESVTFNGTDITDAYKLAAGPNFVLEIEKDGKYSIKGNSPESGTWSLGEDKDDIRFMSSKSGATEQSYRILRLTSKEFWIKETTSNGDVYIEKLKQ